MPLTLMAPTAWSCGPLSPELVPLSAVLRTVIASTYPDRMGAAPALGPTMENGWMVNWEGRR